jgi:DNA polymerase kappa
MERHAMNASDVVSQLRSAVEEKTGLTISAGIAPNKMLAKASGREESPDSPDLLRQEQAEWAI